MFSFNKILSALVLIGNFLFASNTIVIDGSLFTLSLYDSEDVLIQSYPIGIGKNGMGKTKEGDQKTPVGEYEILWKASRFAKEDGGYLIEDGYAFWSDNQFSSNPKTSDSSDGVWTDPYGGDEAVILALNYPNPLDQINGYTGSSIGIHATKLGGIQEFSSAGCIRMMPEDAKDLYNRVEVGSKVFIFE